jgi:hypothetical protein
MQEDRSESQIKKKLVRTLIHFLRRKDCRYTISVLIIFMKIYIAHLMVKRLSFIYVNT